MPRSSNKAPIKVDKYSQAQPKVSPITWISIAGFFVVILAIIFIFSPNNQEKIYNAYTTYGVEDLPKDHPFYQVDYNGGLFKKGLEDLLEKEEVVILYIGYAQCSGCQAHIVPFATYFESTGMNEYVDKVYYMDVTQDGKGFEALAAKYAGIVDSTPQLILFINGEMADIYAAANADTSSTALINSNVRNFYEDAIDIINE
ncbi:MAG: hypothetical protein RBQ71_06660 [Acholeplasmataceae bacterium]|jgi:hypothetical protein|nr:hypothetical protein [Acholeplasmataceae bacterium]